MRRGIARWGLVAALTVALLSGWLLWPGICQNGRTRMFTGAERREYAARNDAAVASAIFLGEASSLTVSAL